MHGLGHEQVRHLGGGLGISEHVDVVALDGRVQGGAKLFPVREQLVQGSRFEHRAGEDMGADFGAFLDHADADFFTGFGGLLFQAACSGQASGACADDDHVEFHVFAFHRFSPTQGSSVFSNWLVMLLFRCCSAGNIGLHSFVFGRALYLHHSPGPIQTFV
ncbi:hypothetical protein D9M71_520250 [compost metagenome]